MSEFLVKSKHFTTKHIWFEPLDPKIIRGADRVFLHGCPTEEKKIGHLACKAVPQETLISDLTATEEELWSLIAKNYRYEINRSKRENTQVTAYLGKEITDDLLYDFDRMFHEMYEEKGISERHLAISELKEYTSKDALVVTTASINEMPVVYHSYIRDDAHSRFLHSCSNFRVLDTAERNAVGRANKYLHWNDWLYLKKLGVKEYDWGGISSYESPNGIDEFKMSFGGSYRKNYNLFCDCSFAARVYDKVRAVMKK